MLIIEIRKGKGKLLPKTQSEIMLIIERRKLRQKKQLEKMLNLEIRKGKEKLSPNNQPEIILIIERRKLLKKKTPRENAEFRNKEREKEVIYKRLSRTDAQQRKKEVNLKKKGQTK